MGKSLRNTIITVSTVAVGLHVFNTLIDKVATSSGKVSSKEGHTFLHKQGDVFYTKQGSGSPILLIHDISPVSSSAEWNSVVGRLKKNHTVYTMDLLGCGKSDKPKVTYTNYLYVQLITAFIENVIKQPCDVIASHYSASSVIMVKKMSPKLVDKIIAINPVSLKESKKQPCKIKSAKKFLLELPVIGTFIYNLMMSRESIHLMFTTSFFKNRELIDSNLESIFYEAAHLDFSHGRFLLASMLDNYINTDISQAVSEIDDLYIIASRDLRTSTKGASSYTAVNDAIDVTYVSNSNLFPHLEHPGRVLEIIERYL